MDRKPAALGPGLLAAALLLCPAAARAELVEEIVAVVNGDIITKSDLENEEQARIADVYRRFAGEELDQRVNEIRLDVLNQMIDRKILLHHAQRLYDLDKMKDVLYEDFMQQQGISSEEEMERLLEQEGFTVEEMKGRLLEMFAPDEVIRYEVSSRVSVGDAELETYYADHPEEFVRPGEVTLREIVLLADNDRDKQLRRAAAADILQRLQGGEDFAEVAAEVSEAGTKREGGLLGPLQTGDLSQRLEEVAFSLPVDEISPVLEMPYGFHIVKIESRRETGVAPLDEIREPLREALRQRKLLEELNLFLRKARSEAEWCVKTPYRERVSGDVAESICQGM